MHHDPADLLLAPAERAELWRDVVAAMEAYQASLPHRSIGVAAAPEELDAYLDRLDFARPIAPGDAVRYVIEGLDRFHVHNAHPRYFGLFVPASSTMGVVAETLGAAFNVNVAAWPLSPFGVAVENRLIGAVASRFGFDPATSEGCFTSGGSEANHTALLVALHWAFPEVAAYGLRAARGEPVLYLSTEGHDSIVKAARLSGLSSGAVSRVPVDGDLRLDPHALADRIRLDRVAGRFPFLVVATAGTTSAGVVDPLRAVAEIAAREGLWLHVDAAWGGAGVLVPELRAVFDGIERADSFTFDAHKWLSVPMTAGLFVTRHAGLESTFSVDAPYMPRQRAAAPGSSEGRAEAPRSNAGSRVSGSREARARPPLKAPPEASGSGSALRADSRARPVEFYRRSMSWARRFTGLKLLMTLAVAGWSGYEEVVRRQIAVGNHLRSRLAADGFTVVNRTALPVVCFVEPGASEERLEAIAERVLASGRAWISTTRVGADRSLVLRAAVTSYHTTTADADALVEALRMAREASPPDA